jgi:hypothetical protein
MFAKGIVVVDQRVPGRGWHLGDPRKNRERERRIGSGRRRRHGFAKV